MLWLLNLGFAAGSVTAPTFQAWLKNANQVCEGEMLKNVAGQTITALLLDTSGAAVTTGTTTIYVTGDGGTQSTGVATGVHEGNGTWSFALSQAESNFNQISFLFTNAGAVSVERTVFTDAAYDRIGATGSGLTSLSTQASVNTIDGIVDAILIDTNDLQTNQGNWLTATGFNTVAPDNASIAAILTDTGTTIPAQIAALNNVSVSEIMDSIVETEGSYTLQQVLSIVLSVLAGVTSDGGATLKTPGGLSTRIAATVNASNERTAMTLTPSA